MTVIVAIDPGTAKCGVAVLTSTKQLLHREVVETTTLLTVVQVLVEKFDGKGIVVGDGTGSRPLQKSLQSAFPSLPIHRIKEDFTTLDARERYFEENPPKGLGRLVPRGLRVPKVPIDDYVATLLAERYWDSVE
jgi:RNase H-fold protein (predicted Holliday junction resolvase)